MGIFDERVKKRSYEFINIIFEKSSFCEHNENEGGYSENVCQTEKMIFSIPHVECWISGRDIWGEGT